MSVERFSRGFSKMAPGTMGGQSRGASLPARRPRLVSTVLPTPVASPPTACLTLRGTVTNTFLGIVGLSSSELVTSDWIETVEGWTWPGIVSNGSIIDETPDYIFQAIPIAGGYAYTRQSADLTTVDLVGPSGVITTWTSSDTECHALVIDASGDYWAVIALDSGTGSVDSALWRVTPGGTATEEVPSVNPAAGVSPNPIATTPDGAVWYSWYGTGSGLYRWDAGTSTAVTGFPVATPIPRPDSSVWARTGADWRSITPGLVVSSDSPCADLDPLGSVTAAWDDDWSIVAIQNMNNGDVYEVG